jgi:hypothetical protein
MQPMTPQRQARLNLVIEALKQVSGIADVWSDDFNNHNVDVFLQLQPNDAYMNYRAGCYHFVHRVNIYKAKIAAVMHKLKVTCEITDWPTLQYESMGGGKMFNKGYDHDSIKLNVWI